MSIWKRRISLIEIAEQCQDTMVSVLGIEFIDFGDDFLRARMPVDFRTLQRFGIMHGGASCALAESVASVAATYCIDQATQSCVGVEINTSHIRPARSGWVIGTATPLHLGRTTQVWQIAIEGEDGKLVSMSRLRMAILDKT